MAEKEVTYIGLALDTGNTLRNRINTLPVGMGVEDVNVEGQIKFSNGDNLVFALMGVSPFVRALLKINDEPPIEFYGDERIVPE